MTVGGVDQAALLRRVRDRLAGDGGLGLVPALRAETRGLVGDRELLELTDLAQAELIGVGPLEVLLADPSVTDVLVNGSRGVWVDRGRGLQSVPVDLGDEDAVRSLAVRLAARAGRRLDTAAPWVDAVMPDGTRLHAVVPPVAADGTVLSLRVHRSRRLTVEELLADGFLDPVGADLVTRAVKASCSVLVSGGTGSGKTTFLGVLLGLVAADERIVVAEDADELRPAHPHVVKLLTRPPNVEGAGEVTLRSLVRQALRMRPDRLVVGEVRGAEVADLLTALNTGHHGGAGTVHANGVHDVPARLAALGATAGLSLEAVHAQTASALDVLLHLRRDGAGRRRLDQVAVVGGDARPVVALAWSRRDGWGPGRDRLEERLASGGAAC